MWLIYVFSPSLSLSLSLSRPLCLADPRQVELHLKPIQSMLRHHKPLVFVLNSPQPLLWRIKTENLAPGVGHTFYVSPASQSKATKKSHFLKLCLFISSPAQAQCCFQ